MAGEFRHHRALKGVDEANAEDVVALGGDVGSRRARGDERDPGVLRDGGGFEGAAGGDFAEEGDDLVARDEFLGNGGGFAGLGLVVLDQQLEPAAEPPAALTSTASMVPLCAVWP